MAARRDMTTSKIPAPDDASDELRAEYALDYAASRPNRFAPRMGGTVVAVVLEPDVAAVFNTSESVNRVLRSVIATLPPGKRRNPTAKDRPESAR